MNNNENKRVSILVDDDQENGTDTTQHNMQGKLAKWKKPLIFGLMAVVFLACIYLIFKPSASKKKVADVGLNDAVPQATGAGLQPDKQKASEEQQLEQKEQEKRNALISLSDYWNEDSTTVSDTTAPEQEPEEEYSYVRGSTPRYVRGSANNGNAALNSYRNAQNTLGSFYQDEDSETRELRRQLDELKEQLKEKDAPSSTTVEDQLALMEKSYQMAARYLPVGAGGAQQQKADSPSAGISSANKEQFAPFTPSRKNVVSAIYREPTDSAFVVSLGENRNRGFYTAGNKETVARLKNSIRASVAETQVVTAESSVKLRLLEPARTPGGTIPQGTEVTAIAKFQNGRLQLKVTSIELDGNFTGVDITIYGLDGQPGLLVPYSPEMNALTEIASNMSQTAGTSIMMTRSAGQQVAGDLSRGLVQGVSGYFSKKIKELKVTLKAGHPVFLVSKN